MSKTMNIISYSFIVMIGDNEIEKRNELEYSYKQI